MQKNHKHPRSIRLEEQQIKQIKEIANEYGISQSDAIRFAISFMFKEFLNNKEVKQ